MDRAKESEETEMKNIIFKPNDAKEFDWLMGYFDEKGYGWDVDGVKVYPTAVKGEDNFLRSEVIVVENGVIWKSSPKTGNIVVKVRDLIRGDADAIINQLDSPEVLSQDWIDKYTQGDWDEWVYTENLQNLLLPEPELPVIPKFAADWVEEHKEDPIYKLLDSDYIFDIHDELARWLLFGKEKTKKERELSLVLAHTYGYEIEKE